MAKYQIGDSTQNHGIAMLATKTTMGYEISGCRGGSSGASMVVDTRTHDVAADETGVGGERYDANFAVKEFCGCVSSA